MRVHSRPTAAALILSLTPLGPASAQERMPVIHANSRVVDVVDGEHVRTGYWYIMPEKKPDTYWVSIPHRPHRVMFRTDRDSIAFDVRYGESYDFIIVLKARDTVHTRIIARDRDAVRPMSTRSAPGQTSDTVPFTLGRDNRIRVAGTINGSQPLALQFDLGAGGGVLKKAAASKVRMEFDSKVTLINSEGTNEVPMSTRNTLRIGGLTWANAVAFAVAGNLDKEEDGLVGNNLFMDRVIEIDYDRRIMIIHDSLPPIPPGYRRESIIRDGCVPFLRATVVAGADTLTDWYMFDTGNRGLVRLSKGMAERRNLDATLRTAFNPFKKTYVFPQFRVGDHAFRNVKGVVHDLGPVNRFGGLIGNALLKRYNAILDNRNGYIYLRPNSLMGSPLD